VARARRNICVVLCLAPAALTAATHQAPPLVHGAYVDIVSKWTDDTLRCPCQATS